MIRGKNFELFLEVRADAGNIVDTVGRRILIFAQFMPATWSIGSSLSTIGLVTSLSNVINAWSGVNTCEGS